LFLCKKNRIFPNIVPAVEVCGHLIEQQNTRRFEGGIAGRDRERWNSKSRRECLLLLFNLDMAKRP
jgi:hypothetical protein